MLKMLILFRNKKRFYSKMIIQIDTKNKLIVTEVGRLLANAKTVKISSEERENNVY